MIVSALSLLLAAAAPASQSWVKLFEEADETAYVRRAGGAGDERMIWIRHDFRRPRAKGIASARDQWLFGCGSKTFTMFALVNYDRSGRVLNAEAIPAEARQAARVVPGSRMEKVLSAVCS